MVFVTKINGAITSVYDWRVEGSEQMADDHPDVVAFLNPPKYSNSNSAKADMVQWITEFTNNVTGPVPIDERLSWDAKEAAARAYIAQTADAAQTAMIEDEAEITGEVPLELAGIIVAKADMFRAVVSKVAGLRRKTIILIDAVTDPADYETILENAKLEANVLATSLGINIQ